MTARPGLVGVLAAVAVLVGGSWYQATVTPPYRFIDEQAHAGYVLAIQSGELPHIDTAIDGEAGGVALRTRLAREPERRRDVWVANNPPLTYVVAAVPAAATRTLGLPGGPLLGLRLVNIAAAAVAVALSYLLARDLAGGDRTVGLVAAGLVAATPHLGFVASLGFNDGTALLATTGVLWALARVAGAGAPPGAALDRSRVIQLGIWCAAAALTLEARADDAYRFTVDAVMVALAQLLDGTLPPGLHYMGRALDPDRALADLAARGVAVDTRWR